MKPTGIVRKTDDLGRIVVPIELRRTLGIAEGDPLEIFVDGGRIILQKYAPGCSACGTAGVSMRQIGNVRICEACLQAAL